MWNVRLVDEVAKQGGSGIVFFMSDDKQFVFNIAMAGNPRECGVAQRLASCIRFVPSTIVST